MTYLAHGATLALAWFFAINALACAAVAVAGRRLPRSAALLFSVRLLPAISSLAFVIAIFVPSYWRFEPRDFVEGFDLTLTACAFAAGLVLAAAIWRGASAWLRAVRRAREWTRTADRIDLAGDISAFRIEARQPLMALVGIFRPRLIVTQGLLDALTGEEIAVSAAHEIAHHQTRDNLKRLLMRGAPDLLHGTETARALERQWAAAAEHDADRSAAAVRSRARRLALASALVKIARLMPAGPAAPITEPISTLVGGGEIVSRVQRLIDDRLHDHVASRRAAAPWVAMTIAAAVALGAAYLPLLEAVHRATETLVHHLP